MNPTNSCKRMSQHERKNMISSCSKMFLHITAECESYDFSKSLREIYEQRIKSKRDFWYEDEDTISTFFYATSLPVLIGYRNSCKIKFIDTTAQFAGLIKMGWWGISDEFVSLPLLPSVGVTDCLASWVEDEIKHFESPSLASLRSFLKPYIFNNMSVVIRSLMQAVDIQAPPLWYIDLFTQTTTTMHNKGWKEFAHFSDEPSILKTDVGVPLTPIDFYSVSEWFALQLEKKGELVTRELGFPLWGRQNNSSVFTDKTILDIYYENIPAQDNIDYQNVNSVYDAILKSNIETCVKILLQMQMKNRSEIKSLNTLLLSNPKTPRYQMLSLLLSLAIKSDFSLLNEFPSEYNI